MRHTCALLVVWLCVLCGQVFAEPIVLTTTNASGGINTVTNPVVMPEQSFALSDIFTDTNHGLGHLALDVLHYIQRDTNHAVLALEGGMLFGLQTHDQGWFINTYSPAGSTNSMFGAGFGIAYLNHNLYDATLNGRISDYTTLPFLRIPLMVYCESGAGYNISENRPMVQGFVGFVVLIPVTHKFTVTFGAAYGTISDYVGNLGAVGASGTFHF